MLFRSCDLPKRRMHRQPRAPKDSVLRSEMLSGQSESLDDQVRAFGDGHLGQQLDVVIERRVSREEALELLRRFLETMAEIGVRDIDFGTWWRHEHPAIERSGKRRGGE